MNLPAIANPVNSLPAAKFELFSIREQARGLSEEGRTLLPVKPAMLAELPDDMIAPTLDALELLFAAILSHEQALWLLRKPADAVALVTARMAAGRAEAIVARLFFGACAHLLIAASDAAPVEFYAMCKAAPKLRISDRIIAAKVNLHKNLTQLGSKTV